MCSLLLHLLLPSLSSWNMGIMARLLAAILNQEVMNAITEDGKAENRNLGTQCPLEVLC
jgi:hypothetical protein